MAKHDKATTAQHEHDIPMPELRLGEAEVLKDEKDQVGRPEGPCRRWCLFKLEGGHAAG